MLVIAVGLFVFSLWQVGNYEARLTRRAFFVPALRAELPPVPVLAFFPGGKPTGIAIIAHGFSANKELMQGFAIELARNDGLVAYLFDFPGHGQAADRLSLQDDSGSSLTASLTAVYDYAQREASTTRSPTGTVLLGHSMGSRTVALYGLDNREVLATIALSPAMTDADLRRFSNNQPRNLLLLAGEQDLPVSVQGVVSGTRYASSGLARGEGDSTVFGSWTNGTARKGKLYPGLNHLTILFSTAVYDEVDRWAFHSLGLRLGDGASLPPTAAEGRLGWVIATLLSAILLTFAVVGLLTTFRDRRWEEQERATRPSFMGSATATYLVMVLFGSVVAILSYRLFSGLGFNPFVFLSVSLTPFLALYFLVVGVVCWLAIRGLNPTSLPTFDLNGVGGGLLVGGLIWLVWYLTLGLATSFSLFRLTFDEHNLYRLPIMLALALLFFPYFSVDEAIWRGWQQNRRWGVGLLGGLLSKLLILAALLVAILTSSDLFFLTLALPVLAILFIIAQFFTAWLYRATGNVWAGAWWQSLFFAQVLAMLFAFV